MSPERSVSYVSGTDRVRMEPTIGLEPMTCRLRNGRGESLQTNPICFQLHSYIETYSNASHSAEIGHQPGHQMRYKVPKNLVKEWLNVLVRRVPLRAHEGHS